MKGIVIAAISMIAGALMACVVNAVSALFAAFILGLTLDSFLELVNAPFLTERFNGLGFGRLFMLVFTFRLIIGVLMPLRQNTKTGGDE